MTDLPAIISRTEAKAQDKIRYFTGKACVRGHFAERHVSNKGCMQCLLVDPEKRKAKLARLADGNFLSDKGCNRCGSLLRGKFKQCLPCANQRRKEPSKRYWHEVLKGTNKPKEYAKKHRQNNKNKCLEYSSRYRIRKKGQSINNANLIKELKEIYFNRPEGWHIDHIVPLKNKLVCGLHCPANLQYLMPDKNGSKHNKWPTCQRSMRPAWFDVVEWCMSAE